MKPKEKKQLLKEMIELMIFCGYDIINVVGKPLSFFNYQFISEFIERLKEEKEIIEN